MGFFNWAAPAFNRLADRWSPDDIEVIAAWLRPYVEPGGRVIDIGGGTGALARKLAEALEADVTVLDPAPEMIRYVPDHGSVEAVLGTAEDMPFEMTALMPSSSPMRSTTSGTRSAQRMRWLVSCGAVAGSSSSNSNPRGS